MDNSLTGPLISDPFTLTYDAIWQILAKSNGLKLVAPNWPTNLITNNDPMGGAPDNPTERDLPEVNITSGTISANFNYASNLVAVYRQYVLLVSTKPGPLGITIYPVEWALSCALTDSQYDEILRQLSWKGQRYIKDVRLVSAQSGQSNSEENRGIQGWAAVWTIECLMVFTQMSMRQFNQGVEITG